jgi:hypothetical protein
MATFLLLTLGRGAPKAGMLKQTEQNTQITSILRLQAMTVEGATEASALIPNVNALRTAMASLL